MQAAGRTIRTKLKYNLEMQYVNLWFSETTATAVIHIFFEFDAVVLSDREGATLHW